MKVLILVKKSNYVIVVSQQKGYVGKYKGSYPLYYGIVDSDNSLIIPPSFKNIYCPTDDVWVVETFEQGFGKIRIKED